MRRSPDVVIQLIADKAPGWLQVSPHALAHSLLSPGSGREQNVLAHLHVASEAFHRTLYPVPLLPGQDEAVLYFEHAAHLARRHAH